MKLYDYQRRSVTRAKELLLSGQRVLLVSPTGSGKTLMASRIAKSFKAPLLVGHRRELIDQAKTHHIREAATLNGALKVLRAGLAVDLLIIDEAHRAAAATYQKIRALCPAAAVLGLTATPKRTDGRGLSGMFDEMVLGESTRALIARGALVSFEAYEAPDEALAELKRMRRELGDYSQRDLAELMSLPRLVGSAVDEYTKHAKGRSAICFAVNVDHSKELRQAFCGAGYRAEHIDGKTSGRARAAILGRLASGALDVLCSVNIFNEGWDCPGVSCVIMARPTLSQSLYLQSVGRGLRNSPGKPNLVILDLAGNIERHGPPDAERNWSLEGDKEIAARELRAVELARLRASGFESLEGYELLNKRRRAESYSLMEAAQLVGVSPSSVCQLFASARTCYGRYLKSAVDKEARLRREEVYSLAEVARLVDSSPSMACYILKKWNVASVRQGFYEKRGVDVAMAAAHAELAATYSIPELSRLAGVPSSKMSSYYAPLWGLKASSLGRYPKAEADRAIESATALIAGTYSLLEAIALCRPGYSLKIASTWLKRHVCRAVRYGRYPKDKVDAYAASKSSGLEVAVSRASAAAA